MINRHAFFNLKFLKRRLYIICSFAILFAAGILMPKHAYAQEDTTYDEIIATLSIQNIGSAEIPAIILKEKAYLPIRDLFDFLKIKSTISPGTDIISGFFINPAAPYVINRMKNTILYNNILLLLNKNDIIFAENDFYLNTDYFGKIFGIPCEFNFRSLTIKLTTNIELPVMREQQQNTMRQNLTSLKGNIKADTIIKKHFSMFHLGTLDWDIASLQANNFKNNRLSMGLGGIIAGGEASVFVNYNSSIPFALSNQFYLWKYVNNDARAIKQVSAGRITTASTVSLLAPLNGVQVSNIPTTYKKSFGSYLVSSTTDPDWIVELYVNDVLVNFTKADGAGFFTFEVPLIYGSSKIKYRFYGPWGEEKFSEQSINIPFTFLPENHFEYALSAGVIADKESSKFSRLSLNYGLTKRVTIGSGAEYLSSAPGTKLMPFVNASVRLGASLIFSGEHTYGVVTKANLNYRFPSKLQLDVTFAKYVPGQTVVRLSYLEEKKAVLSMPLYGKHFSGFSRLTLDRVTLPDGKFTSAEFLLGGMVAGISANITTYALIEKMPIIYTKVSTTFRLPKGVRFTPQLQYEYEQKKFSTVRAEIEKRIFRNSFVNFAYEKNIIARSSGCIFGLRHNFSFAQTGFSAKQSRQSTLISETAGGGLFFDNKAGFINANNQKNVGKGGLVILPFLDYNCNGRRDKNEPDVLGLIVRVNGGRIDRDDKQAAIKVSALEAYNKYFVMLDENSFDNPAWKISNKIIEVTAQPNNFMLIEVPVAVVGEVSGYVYLQSGKTKNGLGRIIINIYNDRRQLVGKTLSEFDGYFNFFGLAPGNYTASTDEAQLAKTKFKNESQPWSFKIQSKK
ncbi:MAG: carboxypeptidase-like regulatory domain-containing protein, partial [Ferruginibacter sp.]